jgi:predicted transcriptional regulator
MNDENRIKEKITKILEEHPEGLHILGISRLVGAHRHTVTKYIHELMGAGVINQREVGTVKLCYLKKDWERLRR